MFSARALAKDTTTFPWQQRTPLAGLRAILPIGVLLLIGQSTGHAAAGAIAAGAAYTVGFAVFHEVLASTLLSMALVALGIASATLAGSLGAEWTWVVLLLAAIAAVNYSVLTRLGAVAGWIGLQCGTFAIVAGAFTGGWHYAVGRTAMVLLGGAAQMLFFALMSLFHRSRKLTVTLPPGSRPDTHPDPITNRIVQRLRDYRLTLDSGFAFEHDTFSYTVRMAVGLVLATAIYRHFHMRNGYWLPMTTLLVLKPHWSQTFSRGVARLLGTLAGAGLAALIALLLPPLPPPVVLALVVLCAWGSYALQAVNYAAFSAFVTLYIVFLFHFGGITSNAAAHIRLFNTALGGAIALLVDSAGFLLTRWPRTKLHAGQAGP